MKKTVFCQEKMEKMWVESLLLIMSRKETLGGELETEERVR